MFTIGEIVLVFGTRRARIIGIATPEGRGYVWSDGRQLRRYSGPYVAQFLDTGEIIGARYDDLSRPERSEQT